MLQFQTDQWAERTQRLLAQITEIAGEAMAQRVASALQCERDYLLQSICEPQFEQLQLRIDDLVTVLQQQERELIRLKATKTRRRIAELELQCANLQVALDRKPADEAAERTALVEELLCIGEQIQYQALSSTEMLLIGEGCDSYCSFCSSATIERLRLANEAAHFLLQMREGRKKLAKMEEGKNPFFEKTRR